MKFLVGGPVEDINRTALINKDFLDSIIFDFNSDDHGVVLLVVKVVEVIICEDDRRHTASVVGMVMWLMDCIWRRCLFLAEEVEPSLAKPSEMVLMVPRKEGSARVMSVRAGSSC